MSPKQGFLWNQKRLPPPSYTLFSDCCSSKRKRHAYFWLTLPRSNGIYCHFYTNEFCLSQSLPHPAIQMYCRFPWGEGIGSLKQHVESSLNWRVELKGQAHVWDCFGGLERGQAHARQPQMAALGLCEQRHRSINILAILDVAKVVHCHERILSTSPFPSQGHWHVSQLSTSLSPFLGSPRTSRRAIACVASGGVKGTMG